MGAYCWLFFASESSILSAGISQRVSSGRALAFVSRTVIANIYILYFVSLLQTSVLCLFEFVGLFAVSGNFVFPHLYVSPPLPAACLGSFFSPRLVLPSEPVPEAPLLSPFSARSWRARFLLGPVTPRIFRSRCADVPVKPLHPTSTGKVNALHPACEHVADRSAYLSFFRSYAASICSSHGTVSSTMMTALAGADQSTMSGHRAVMVISAGNFSWRSRSAANCYSPPIDKRDRSVLVQRCALVPGLVNWIHFGAVGGLFLLASCLRASRISASLRRTLSCRHLYLPWGSSHRGCASYLDLSYTDGRVLLCHTRCVGSGGWGVCHRWP